MSDYVVAKLEQIQEISDGRCPWRPVRHHLGISAFGVNAFTGKKVGDRSSTSTTKPTSATCTRSSTSSSRDVRGSS
jgi:hypothetical protein